MIGRVTKRVARVVLAVSVSLWMAGAGCMFGCSNMTVAAQSNSSVSDDKTTVVASNSCHARTHDCCAKGAQQKSSISSSNDAFLFGSTPQGMMKDCPLAVRGTAVSTSKSTQSASDLALSPPVTLRGEGSPARFAIVPTVPIRFLNRGPTYLRCCVFLI